MKNEVLFNIRRHPLTKLSHIPRKDWPKLAEAVHDYCWNFYKWKKKYELRRHWQVYKKWKCPLCQESLVREKDGRLQRKSFFCERHQKPLRAKLVVHDVLPVAPSRKREAPLDH